MNQVGWIVDLNVKQDAANRFIGLTNEMIAAALVEPGCLTYQRFFSSDQMVCRILERYTDSDAAYLHLLMFKTKFGPRYNVLVDRKSFWVFGPVGPSLARELDHFAPQYHPLVFGFAMRS